MADAVDDRARIVDAADRLFYGRGIQAVGMDAVRAESGVPLKRLYASFASKEALVEAVMRHRMTIWAHGIATASADAATPRDRLLAIYDFLDAWFRDDDFRGCGFINAFGELGAVSPVVARLAQEQKASFQAYVADLVDDLGARGDLALQLSLLAEGAQTTAAIDGSPTPAAHARQAASVLIDAALAARG